MEHPQVEPSWRDLAACIGLDHNLFFPKRGQSTRKAKGVCEDCRVREECLEDAIVRKEIAGIRGGKSKRERDSIARQRKVETNDEPRLYNGNRVRGFTL